MEEKKCKKYNTCNAPLCPLDKQSLKHGIWYPDEKICALQKYGRLLWVRNQRKLAKRAVPHRYFTYRMLKQNCIIKKGITGLDPDNPEPEEKQIEKWLKAHPVKRELTEEERKIAAERLLKNIGKYKRTK